jgi:transcriptional regulator with XRE-family HTH domain
MENAKDENLEPIRVAIHREFISRCRKNPSYSLRAFAKFLNIDQSFLSKLLKGQRAVTAELAETLAPKLGIRLQEVKLLVKNGANAMPGFLPLSDDEFEFISEWKHFAILELAKTDDFDSDPLFIAQRLGIHVEEVRDALSRLERMNFIRFVSGKIKILSPNHSWSNNKKTSVSRQKLQRDLLEKSLYALDHVPFELRDNGSLTVAINPDRLPEFKEKLKEIRKELADFFQKDGEDSMTEVYQLTMSLFPLTKIKKQENKNENN